MKMSKNPFPLATLRGLRDQINTNPDYQRPAVWRGPQKQLLVDTILRGYDIPKLYWRQIETKGNDERFEVVDGQQRLRAIWEFFDGKFKLPNESEAINGENIAGCKYSDLSTKLKIKFDVYALDVVILDTSEEDDVRDMFLRLQNGTTLRAQERRNAYPGKMRDFVKILSKHQFFDSVHFSNRRYQHDLVAAQFICLELAGGPTNIKKADLDKMYLEHKDFDEKSSPAKQVHRILDKLRGTFPEKTPELEHHSVISLYCVVSQILEQYAENYAMPVLGDWFIKFEQERSSAEAKNDDEEDKKRNDWLEYKDKTGHSTDAVSSIQFRVDFMLTHFLSSYPDLPLKDKQRLFTEAQRKAIYRKDKMHCQLRIKCDGKRLSWDNWHCDHIKPWTKGGPTTVANGQAACAECNQAKGAN